MATTIDEVIDLFKQVAQAQQETEIRFQEIAHLLKLTIQFDVPETMKMSWYRSVAEHRKRVLLDIKDAPSLKAFLPTALVQAYPDARDLAIRESKFAVFGMTPPPEEHYPLACPFSLEQLLDEDFYG
ncbi:MAG: DUF29 domain-containing protein [Synechocystis sp.]